MAASYVSSIPGGLYRGTLRFEFVPLGSVFGGRMEPSPPWLGATCTVLPQLDWAAPRQLFSGTGYHLQLRPDGSVAGVSEADDKHAILHLQCCDIGVVQIKGAHTGMYLGMDNSGRLYCTNTPNEETRFHEVLEEGGFYTMYKSVSFSHLDWYVGITKAGEPKLANRTGPGQKACLFLPRQIGVQVQHSNE